MGDPTADEVTNRHLELASDTYVGVLIIELEHLQPTVDRVHRLATPDQHGHGKIDVERHIALAEAEQGEFGFWP